MAGSNDANSRSRASPFGVPRETHMLHQSFQIYTTLFNRRENCKREVTSLKFSYPQASQLKYATSPKLHKDFAKLQCLHSCIEHALTFQVNEIFGTNEMNQYHLDHHNNTLNNENGTKMSLQYRSRNEDSNLYDLCSVDAVNIPANFAKNRPCSYLIASTVGNNSAERSKDTSEQWNEIRSAWTNQGVRARFDHCFEQRKCRHAQHCKYWEYGVKTTMSSTNVVDNELSRYVKLHGMPQAHLTILQITFRVVKAELVTENLKVKVSFIDFISGLGGILGLFLGASILSCVQLCVFATKYSVHAFKQRFKNRVQQRKVAFY